MYMLIYKNFIFLDDVVCIWFIFVNFKLSLKYLFIDFNFS